MSFPDFSRLQYIREVYDKLANVYGSLYLEESIAKYVAVLENIIQNIDSNCRYLVIVDLGCGTGVGLGLLLSCRLFSYVVGIDISIESLRKIRGFLRKRFDIDVVQCIMEMLPFRSQCFDIVISVSSLDTDCKVNYTLQIRESTRVCRFLQVHVPVRGNIQVIRHVIEKGFKFDLQKAKLTGYG